MNTKLLLLFAIALSAAVAHYSVAKLTRSDIRLKRIRRILNRKGLMKCILIHDFQRLPDSDCLVKYHLSHRYERIISIMSKVVIDIVYKKHACLDLGKIPSLKSCMKVVRLDFRRSFHLTLHTVEEKIFFKEIVTKFVRYISFIRQKLENTVNVDINQALKFTRPDEPQQVILDEGTEPEIPQIRLAMPELPSVEVAVLRPDDFDNEDVEDEEQKRKNDLKRFIHMNQLRKEIANRLDNQPSPTNKYVYKYPPKFSFDLSRNEDKDQEEELPEAVEDREEEPEETEVEEPDQKPSFIAIDQVPFQRGQNIDLDKLNQAINEKFNQQPTGKIIDATAPQKRDENDDDESSKSDGKKEPVVKTNTDPKPNKPIAQANANGEQVVSIPLNELLNSNEADKKNIGQHLANLFKDKTNIPIDQAQTIPINQVQEATQKPKKSVPKQTAPVENKNEPKTASITYTKKHHPHHSIHKKHIPKIHGKIVLSKAVPPQNQTQEPITQNPDNAQKDEKAPQATLRREADANAKNNEKTSSEDTDSEESSNPNEQKKVDKKNANANVAINPPKEVNDDNKNVSQAQGQASTEVQKPKKETEVPAKQETAIDNSTEQQTKPQTNVVEKEQPKVEVVKESVKAQPKKEEEENSSADDEDPLTKLEKNGWNRSGQQTNEKESEKKAPVPTENNTQGQNSGAQQGTGVQISQDSTKTKKARKAHNVREIHITIELPKKNGEAIQNPPKEGADKKATEIQPAKPAQETPVQPSEQKTEPSSTPTADKKQEVTAAPAKDKKENEANPKTDTKEAGKDAKNTGKDTKDAGKDTKDAKTKPGVLAKKGKSATIFTTLMSLALALLLL